MAKRVSGSRVCNMGVGGKGSVSAWAGYCAGAVF